MIQIPKAGQYDFPTYDIDSILEKLKIAHDTIRKDEMDRDLIADTLGMSPRGGGFSAFISSLEKYALVETAWGGKVTITDIGKLAIYGLPPEQQVAKIEAVSYIQLFYDVYQRYGVNATEEQFRAFLRQEANVDVTKVRRLAQQAYRIYKNVAKYISPIASPEQAEVKEPAGIDRSETLVPPRDNMTPPLKIQYGGVYIQVPPDDLEAIALAKQALEFMESVIKKKKE